MPKPRAFCGARDPQTVDNERGGFNAGFTREWKTRDSEGRVRVFQGRMMWVTVRVAIRHPEWRDQSLPIARHGAIRAPRVWEEISRPCACLWVGRKLRYFCEDGTTFGKCESKLKEWWGEFAGLNALLLMHDKYGKQDDAYFKAFQKQWQFIKNYQIDAEYHGVYKMIRPDGKIVNAASGRAYITTDAP